MTTLPAEDALLAPLQIVLVHWNQPERCATTVAAFESQGPAVEILIVDNGSTPEALAALDPLVDAGRVRVIAQGRNTGFGPAANIGIRWWLAHRTGDLVVVAPHDALPQVGCLDAIVDTLAARPEIGLTCADVGDGETPVVDPYFGSISVPARQSSGFEPADYPHGTLLVARRACVVDVGLFDERYFAYCEEADLGLRARRAGWEVGIVRDAAVRNPAMGPGPGPDVVDYLQHRNTLLLVRDHSGRYHASIRFVAALLALLRGLLDPGSRPVLFAPRGRVWGLADHLRGRYGAPPWRLFPPSTRPSSAAATAGRTSRR